MNKKFKILISMPYPKLDLLKKILKDIAYIEEKALSQEKLEEEMKNGDYDAVICWEFSQKITRNMILSANQRLKIIATISVGYDHIDVDAAQERGIKIINAGSRNICASTYSVAEFAFWFMLMLVRKTRYVFDAVKKDSPAWSELSQGRGAMGSELFNKTLGIIGVGRIGSHVGRIGKGFCMDVIGYDPYVDSEIALQKGVRLVNKLEELLSRSDVISINCCLTHETNMMLGKQEVSLMKDGVYIANPTRGEIVNEYVILEALRKGRIAGYAADALTGEPPTEKTSPLLAAYRNKENLNLIITPHIAWTCKEGVAKRYPLIIGNRIKAALMGKELEEWELLR